MEYKNGKIVWQSVYDHNATDLDLDLSSQACGEFISDFPNLVLEEQIVKIPFPNKINTLENLVYFRHEHNYFKE